MARERDQGIEWGAGERLVLAEASESAFETERLKLGVRVDICWK